MNTVRILDKEFELCIPSEKIQEVVARMAGQMNADLAGNEVVFMPILNGAFMFASDLLRRIGFACQISFLRLASYEGTASSGSVKQLIGITEKLHGKTVVVIEDIVDSGQTLDYILRQLSAYEPAEIRVAALLFKPESYRYSYPIQYTGMEIPAQFVVGYGLDYEGYGRNLEDIYQLKPKNSETC